MEKVYFTGGIKTLNDPVFNVLRLLQDKENEIIDWINEQTKDTKRLWINLIDLQKGVLKISTWIKEHEKYVEPLEKAWREAVEQTLEQAQECKEQKQPKNTIAGKPTVTRYELSGDKVGLVAFLADGFSYHIHSNELTPEQVSIREQLLEMERR